MNSIVTQMPSDKSLHRARIPHCSRPQRDWRRTERRTSKAVFVLAAVCSLWLQQAWTRGQDVFTAVTTGEIVEDLGVFTRPVWADFNNDGALDLFVSGFSDRRSVFYLNNGNGTFTKRTQGEPVIDVDFHSGGAAGDYDNDGHVDLLVAAGVIASNARRNKLYHNMGNAVFERVSNSPITSGTGFFNSCAWADYDNDGLLDVVLTDGSEERTGKAFLFHNEGASTFTAAVSNPVTSDSNSGNAVWADYDGDGFMDLLISNAAPNSRTLLYHNDRRGAFSRVTTNAIATDPWVEGVASSAWGDYDNDGLLDLFTTGLAGSTSRLYRNTGAGQFQSVAAGPLLELSGGHSVWGDYDNDGCLDLFVSNYDGPNSLFHNRGDGSFAPVDLGAIAADLFGMSPVLVDYDNDGFLDLFLTHALFNGNLVANSLYHNNGNANHWLEVKLAGTVANRSGIGAKVRVQATINGKTFWQLREINNGGGWNIQTLVAHFGLGGATNVQTVRIEWPSGTVQELHDVASNQILTVTEPARFQAGISNRAPRLVLNGGRNLTYDVQTSIDLKSWNLAGSITITNGNGAAVISDENGMGHPHLYYRAVLR